MNWQVNMGRKLDVLMRVPESFFDPPVFLDFFFSWSGIFDKPVVFEPFNKMTSKKYCRYLYVKK